MHFYATKRCWLTTRKPFYTKKKCEFNINLLFVTYEGKGQKLRKNVKLTATLHMTCSDEAGVSVFKRSLCHKLCMQQYDNLTQDHIYVVLADHVSCLGLFF